MRGGCLVLLIGLEDVVISLAICILCAGAHTF
jgi:hypothetical protein